MREEHKQFLLQRLAVACWIATGMIPFTIITYNHYFYPEALVNGIAVSIPCATAALLLIDLRKVRDNKYTLIVGDNGVGFPNDIDLRNPESLGLQLVTNLTD